MKISLRIILFLCCVLLSGNVFGGEMNLPPYVGTPDFERLKLLVGTWKGTEVMSDKEPKDVTAEYTVTSNGSAVMEKLFPGTQHEMVSIYHDRDGKVAMTHYCSLGNRPFMVLKESAEGKLDLVLSQDSEIDVNNEPHMHALTISWDDEDHITHKWTFFEEGEKKGENTINLSRVK